MIFEEWSKFRPFLEVRKKFKLLEHKNIIIYHFKARDLGIPLYNLFREIFKFYTKAFPNFAKLIIVYIINFNISRNKIIQLESPDHTLQNDTYYVYVLRV